MEHVSGREQPFCLSMTDAAFIPILTQSFGACPLMCAARNPPANASPHPFPSAINSFGTVGTGKLITCVS